VLPPSLAPPFRGPAVNVTAELRPDVSVDPANGVVGGLIPPMYTAIMGQVAGGLVAIEWTADPEYLTPTLITGGPAPGPHGTDHSPGGVDPVPLIVDAESATVNMTSQAFHETYVNVEASATSKGTIAENVAGPVAPTGQPSHPRVLEVVFPAGWSGGNVIVSGVLADGTSSSETFVSAPGTTVVGVRAFATITDFTNSAPGGDGADSATVRTSTAIGASAGINPFTFYKLSVDGVDEAFSTTDGTNGTWTPTTAPNGLREYEVWYRYAHGHSPNPHSHTLS
jgi:hypothetical protein